MTELELKELLPEVARTCRGYVDWREKEIARQAWANNTKTEEEAAELRGQWLRVLSRVDLDAARIVLRRIESGELEVPAYDFGKLPAIIRREARGYNTLRIHTPQSKFREEPKYRCLKCLDTSIVEVINPAWIRQHISEIESGLPDGWYAEARRWCREHDVGPLKATVVCYCDNSVAVTQRDRLAKYRRGELPKDQIPARRDIYNEKSMPALESNSPTLIADQLQKWIASYSPSDAFEWQPNPDDYAEYV